MSELHVVPMASPPAVFLDTKEAAERLGFHKRTLQEQLRVGTVTRCCFHRSSTSGRYRINARAIEFFLEHSRWPSGQQEFSAWMRAAATVASSSSSPAPARAQMTAEHPALEHLPEALASKAASVLDAVGEPVSTELDATLARFPPGAIDYGHVEPWRNTARRTIPARIHVAGAFDPDLLAKLRAAGLEVRERPESASFGFHALVTAEVCLLVLPGDGEAMLEAGWFAAHERRRLVVLTAEEPSPTIAQLADAVVSTLDEAVAELDRCATTLRNAASGFGNGEKVLFSTPRVPERVSTILGAMDFRPVAVDARAGWSELAGDIATQAELIEASSELGHHAASTGKLVLALHVESDAAQSLGPKPLLLDPNAFSSALECAWVSGFTDGQRTAKSKIELPRTLTDEEFQALRVPEQTQLSIDFEDDGGVAVIWVELDGEASRRELLLPRKLVYGSIAIRIATALEVMLRTVTGADWISMEACNAVALKALEDLPPRE